VRTTSSKEEGGKEGGKAEMGNTPQRRGLGPGEGEGGGRILYLCKQETFEFLVLLGSLREVIVGGTHSAVSASYMLACGDPLLPVLWEVYTSSTNCR